MVGTLRHRARADLINSTSQAAGAIDDRVVEQMNQGKLAEWESRTFIRHIGKASFVLAMTAYDEGM